MKHTFRTLVSLLLCGSSFALHGAEDKLIPVSVVEEFQSGMKAVGGRCEVHIYPKAGHGFFNREPHFTSTLIETDKFLTSLGWLSGEPTLEAALPEPADKPRTPVTKRMSFDSADQNPVTANQTIP